MHLGVPAGNHSGGSTGSGAMTQLVDVMSAMGLHGEVGRSGRWIRFPGERGTAYVVEAAWGSGYYTFFDAPAGSSADDPAARGAIQIYLDPISAIEACVRSTTGTQVVVRGYRPPARGAAVETARAASRW